MLRYKAMCDANHAIIRGDWVSTEQKRSTVSLLLEGAAVHSAAERFRDGVKAEGKTRALYPDFYLPPYNNGKRLRILTGQLPQTHIFAANHYELEILRLLLLWDGGNPRVQAMAQETLARLEKTCFGHFCPTGECVGAGVSALRFYLAACPEDKKRLRRLAEPLGRRFLAQKGMASYKDAFPIWYFCLTLAELDLEIVWELLEVKRDFLLRMLTRGCTIGPSITDTYNPLILHVIRNALARLPGCEALVDAPITVADNGRCYCEIHEQSRLPSF